MIYSSSFVIAEIDASHCMTDWARDSGQGWYSTRLALLGANGRARSMGNGREKSNELQEVEG